MDAAWAAIDCHEISTALLVWIGRALLLGTALAGATWLLVRLLGRRLHPGMEAALWLIVLVRFLTPMGPEWEFSFATLLSSASPRPSVSDTLPMSWPADEARGFQSATPEPTAVVGATSTTGTTPAPQASDDRRLERPAASGAADRTSRWTTLVAVVYLSSVAVLFCLRIRRYRAFVASCRSLPPADDRTHQLVARVCSRLGLRRVPSSRSSEASPAPFVVGLWHPILVLPRRRFVRPDELETVVVHEVAHLRRGDMLVRHLQWIAGTWLFFWPVVAWVNRRIDTAREYACDAWALRHGQLTASQYARCLLSAARPRPYRRYPDRPALWPVFEPACMGGQTTNIERRIDMILDSSGGLAKRPVWGLLTLALILSWGGFALTGAASANQHAASDAETWPATEEAVKQHAVQLYHQVAQRAAADLNGDGVLAYREKTIYLIGLAAQEQDAFIEEFPFADRNHNGHLDFWEAHDAIRGITLIAYADRRPDAAPGARLDLEFYHLALEAQQWLMDSVTAEPSATDIANIRPIVVLCGEDPRSDHVRKLNHGGPEEPRKARRPRAGAPPRFGELEGSIADLEAKLAAEQDADESARLEAMIAKLRGLLAKLEQA